MPNRTGSVEASPSVHGRSIPILFACALGVVVAATSPAAQVVRPPDNALSRLTLRSQALAPSQPILPLEDYQGAAPGAVPAAVVAGWTAFHRGAGADWQASVDQRTGLVASSEGTGIPWIPGAGNSLSPDDVSQYVATAGRLDLAILEAIARRELERLGPLFGLAGEDLVLNRERSGNPAPHVWLVDFDLVRDGLVVEGARVLFRVNNGNLIQFGSENLPAPGSQVPSTRLGLEQAVAVMTEHIGGLTRADTMVDPGTLHLLPANVVDPDYPAGFPPGRGRELIKVWQFVFRRQGVIGTFRARVDAATGELLEFEDVNRYAQAAGGVAADATAGTETVRPLPFVDLGGGVFANSAGRYTFAGTPLTSALNGQFVRITDTCGAISLTTDGPGNLPFATAGGNNCTTPGIGGAGNTRSARTSFYSINRAKEIARGWLPGNAFLNGQVTASVNQTGTCNGFWDFTQINLFRAVSGSCGASGEEPGFILHELGHAIDQNDGTGAADGGTGESYGDLTAAMVLHNSCVGPGFRLGNCGGYGDACTACTGLRDVDWGRHASNTPHTVSNYAQTNCAIPDYPGPCGNAAHCEAHISSEAVWDFANRDLPAPGSNAAWAITERLWYLSRTTATNAFSCTPGPTFTSDGCNLGSWWKTMRAVDDDDGNLANGTPHGGALFAAFDRHGIACGGDPGAGVTFAACSPPAVPAMTLSPGDDAVAVTVAGSGVFDLFRNELGCNAGFVRIADDFIGGTFTDHDVVNGTAYFYQAVAHPSGNEACASAPSPCLSATPAVAPQIQVPGPVDVGEACAGATGAATLEVCNNGSASLVVGAITSSNPLFAVTVPSSGYPVTLAPTACFPFQVTFNPTTPGPQSATLAIPSNDPLTPIVNVTVSGAGTEPDVRVIGSTDFGVASAWTPAEKAVSVCNVGGCPLTVTSAAVGCADFTVVGSPFPAPVAPGSCLDLVVRFTPVLPGPKSCILTIASDDPDTPAINLPLTARTPPSFSLHAGLVEPHSPLNGVATLGSTLHLDFVYPWTPNWAWDVRLGLSRFDGRAGNPDIDLTTLAANARFTLNPAVPVHVFLNAGLGLYHFSPGSFEGGGNLGLGLDMPLGSRFAFELTYNYRSAFTASPSLDFSEVQAGFLVSF
jgi:hypothetical protein